MHCIIPVHYYLHNLQKCICQDNCGDHFIQKNKIGEFNRLLKYKVDVKNGKNLTCMILYASSIS